VQRLIAAAVMAMGLMGCNKMEQANTSPIPVIATHPSTDQIFAGLRFEAKKRGLRWEVFCVPGDDFAAQKYQADAEYSSTPRGAIFVEEGAKNSWYETGDTPQDAAYALYKDLASGSAPDMEAPDTPKPRDCNYQNVYDSDHDGKLPCSKSNP